MEIKDMVFQITEFSAKIETGLEKIDVLASDIADSRLDRIDLNTEVGQKCMEKELRILRVKMDVLEEYAIDTYRASRELLSLSEDTHDLVKEQLCS